MPDYRRAYAPGGTVFFTLVTENRRPLFEEPAAVALFLGAVEKVRARHPFEVDAYVVAAGFKYQWFGLARYWRKRLGM